MSYFDEASIDVMLAEVGEPITIAGNAGVGVFDETDEELLKGEMAALIGKTVALTVKTTAFPPIAISSAVVRTGPPTVNYVIRERLQLGDGALTKILCALA